MVCMHMQISVNIIFAYYTDTHAALEAIFLNKGNG